MAARNLALSERQLRSTFSSTTTSSTTSSSSSKSTAGDGKCGLIDMARRFNPADIVTFRVHDRKFSVSKAALMQKCPPSSVLGYIFSSDHQLVRDENNAIIAMCDKTTFNHILNWITYDTVPVGLDTSSMDLLMTIARHWQLDALLQQISSAESFNNSPMSQQDFNRCLEISKTGGISLPNRNLSSLFCSGVTLKGADFSACKMNKINFANSVLTETDLSGADLTRADFKDADLSSAILQRANLSFANFNENVRFPRHRLDSLEGACLSSINFQGCNLSAGLSFKDVDLSKSNLKRCNFSNADFRFAKQLPLVMDDADFRKANFSGRNLSEITFLRSNLQGANLSNADLSDMDLSETNLTDANLSGAILFGAILPLDLRGVNFSSCTFLSRDFSNHRLDGANFSHCDLSSENLLFPKELLNVTFHGSILVGADFSDRICSQSNFIASNCTQTNFSAARLDRCNFQHASLSSALMWKSDLTLATLNNTQLPKNLQGVNLTQCDLSDYDLSSRNLTDVNFTSTKMISANLTDSNLSHANLTTANFTSANFTGAILIAAQLPTNLSHLNFSCANFSQLDLSRCNLSSSDLSAVNLTSAILTNVNLANTNLTAANLTNTRLPTNLQSTNLSECDLSGRDLRYSNLTNANLTHANLTNANLTNANLTNATLFNLQLGRKLRCIWCFDSGTQFRTTTKAVNKNRNDRSFWNGIFWAACSRHASSYPQGRF